MPSSKRFKIAQISSAHGIRGEVKLFCFLENPRDIARYNPLTAANGKIYQLTITGQIKDALVARIEGVNDRNAAELLRGVEFFVDSKKLPNLAANEFYYQDLIGLLAVLENGEAVGKVVAIHNFGAGDILEIRTPENEEILLPFQAPFVDKITSQNITVTLPNYVGEE